ncbi:MAG TPA: hypothetical protein VF288_10690 [Mycobacteriales bacterium]
MTSRTVRDTLVAARALVERGWCRGYAAVTAEGVDCDPRDPRAVRWTAIGALPVADRSPDRSEWMECVTFLRRGARLSPTADFGAWNNDPRTTRPDVLAAFDGAIKAAS